MLWLCRDLLRLRRRRDLAVQHFLEEVRVPNEQCAEGVARHPALPTDSAECHAFVPCETRLERKVVCLERFTAEGLRDLLPGGFLREIDRRTGAKPIFAVSGIPGTVRSGIRALWRELAPLLREERDFSVWPFEEDLRIFPPARRSCSPRSTPGSPMRRACREVPDRPRQGGQDQGRKKK